VKYIRGRSEIRFVLQLLLLLFLFFFAQQ
jgi:hypothetical protein